MNELTERIIELEIRYTHQTRLVEELNMELTSANSRIDQLDRQVKALYEIIGNLSPEYTESPDE